MQRFPFALAVLALGCSVFDENRIPDESGGPGDQNLLVADDLGCSVPLNASLNSYRNIDTSQFDNNNPALPNCLGAPGAPGNDAFFAVEMKQAEKWHFHVDVSSDAIDPAVYMLESCSDARTCRDTYWGINACGDGEDEHFSFLAPTTSTYYVGIDSMRGGGEPFKVFAVRAECGNGVREHSEACDDGAVLTESCQDCRPVLAADGPEAEPNDGPLDPNHLRFPPGGGSLRITGTFPSGCDFDFLQVEVPAGNRLQVALDASATDCLRADLEIREPGSPNPFLVNPIGTASGCTELERTDVTAATHLIRVASRREPGVRLPAANYALEVTLTPL